METDPAYSRTTRIITAIIVIFIVLALFFAYTLYWPGLFQDGVPDFPDWCREWYQEEDSSQWSHNMTGIDRLNGSIDGSGIVIGIVDTGIDYSHPEFEGTTIIYWLDLIKGESEPYDDSGHGTAMASIIVGNDRVEGVARGVSLIVVKAIPGNGTGQDSLVADAIDFCADPNNDGDHSDGADIISLSLGGGSHPRFGSESGDAANNAIAQGIVVIASAGNDGLDDDGDVESPATEELVIAIGAVDEDGNIANFSSEGDNDGRTPLPGDDRQDPNKKPELVAPGVEITAAYPEERYVLVSGTSPAAAFASGMVALLLQQNPEFTKNGSSQSVSALKTFLMEKADKLPGQYIPHDDHYGYGLIHIEA